MKKERNTDEVFGDLPFKSLQKIEIKVNGLKTRDDAAFLQYQLLTKPAVIRCHIEFSNQTGTLLFNQLETSTGEILKGMPKPFGAKLLSEQTIPYRQLLSNGYHLEKK